MRHAKHLSNYAKACAEQLKCKQYVCIRELSTWKFYCTNILVQYFFSLSKLFK